MLLEKFLKLIDCEPRILHNGKHGECIDRVRSWNRQRSETVRHNDVAALADDIETCSLQRLDRLLM